MPRKRQYDRVGKPLPPGESVRTKPRNVTLYPRQWREVLRYGRTNGVDGYSASLQRFIDDKIAAG